MLIYTYDLLFFKKKNCASNTVFFFIYISHNAACSWLPKRDVVQKVMPDLHCVGTISSYTFFILPTYNYV